jgi:hypothetical protein
MGMVVHTCNPPSTWEAEAEDHEFSSSLSYIMTPCLKNKTKDKVIQAQKTKNHMFSLICGL